MSMLTDVANAATMRATGGMGDGRKERQGMGDNKRCRRGEMEESRLCKFAVKGR